MNGYYLRRLLMKTIKTLLITMAVIAVISGGSIALADSGTLSASFVADVNTGAAPLTVHFEDQSGGSPTGWQWDFGDGSYSTLQSPTYTYNTPGTYTVTLTVTDGAQSDAMSGDVVVTNPLVTTPTPSPGRVPVIVQPILVPVKDPHHVRPPHDDVQPPAHKAPHKDQPPAKKQPVKDQPPAKKQPVKDQPVKKDPPVQKQPVQKQPVHKQPPQKSPGKQPTENPKHR
jgi:PKD repeat protein